MAFLFTALLFVVLLACVAFLYGEGMWGNAIRLVNVLTAALLATNFWEPVARILEDSVSKEFSYGWDIVALWGLFSVFFVVMTVATGYASRVKVRFLGLADRIGSIAFAVLVGYVMVCFTTMSLHTAPLAKNFMGGGFNPEKRMFLGLAPDRQWLQFTEWVSKGSLSRWSQGHVFDPGHEFIPRYSARREQFQAHVESGSGGVKNILVDSSPTR
jgi:hypothetical protein